MPEPHTLPLRIPFIFITAMRRKKNPPHLATNKLIRKLCALSVDGLQGETHQTHLDLKLCALLSSQLISPADSACKPGRSADNGLPPPPPLIRFSFSRQLSPHCWLVNGGRGPTDTSAGSLPPSPSSAAAETRAAAAAHGSSQMPGPRAAAASRNKLCRGSPCTC